MFAHPDAVQATGTDIVVGHRSCTDDVKASFKEESSGIIVHVLDRNPGRAGLLTAVAVEAFENLAGDIVGRLDFAAQQAIEQYQLAARAVDFPPCGLVDRAMFITVSASDTLVEGASPFF
jgi:hypothetical protein